MGKSGEREEMSINFVEHELVSNAEDEVHGAKLKEEG